MDLLNKFGHHAWRRYERFYRGRYFHLTVDIILLIIILLMGLTFLVLERYQPTQSSNRPVIHQEKNITDTSTDSIIKKEFSETASTKALSKLKAKAEIYYHSPQGDQLGSGPVPPIVGIATNYWLFFKMENSGNEVGNFIMSAKLPNNVSFTGSKTLSAGTVSYQAERHLLIWKIEKIAKEDSFYSAGFEIELTPTQEQIGKNASLANSIFYSGDDLEAKRELSGSLPNMTSALNFDKINKGQGVVEELK